jgi:RecJ-like exonuclease
MDGPIICGKCIGMGYVTMCGGEQRACPVCDGTGKVWASVEGEVVISTPENPSQYTVNTYAKIVSDAMHKSAQGCVVIVQPLKEGESSASP